LGPTAQGSDGSVPWSSDGTRKDEKRILEDFRTKMGLVVDQPRSKGSGNSNEGNTARTFFNNSELSAKITGLD